MQHLDPERLAAFDHEAPTAGEQAHLAACAHCRQERDAYARLAELATVEAESGADVGTMPLTNWDQLSGALHDAGLMAPVLAPVLAPVPVAEPAQRARVVARGGWRWRSIARAAAAVLLLVGGVAIGRSSVAAPAVLPALADNRSTGAVNLVSNGAATEADPGFTSVAEATRALERAQADFQRASLWLNAHDTTVNAQAVYRARLAALDEMMQATRAGLYEAPQDPALNQYYMATYTAREATLRQLGASLPVDRVMESY